MNTVSLLVRTVDVEVSELSRTLDSQLWTLDIEEEDTDVG